MPCALKKATEKRDNLANTTKRNKTCAQTQSSYARYKNVHNGFQISKTRDHSNKIPPNNLFRNPTGC